MTARTIAGLVTILGVACVATGCGSSEAGPRGDLPQGFVDELVAKVERPTALAFTPDGRTLVATQPGLVRVIDAHGRLLRKPALDIHTQVCTERERALGAIAVDPHFQRNRYVYIYYTFKKFGVCPIEAPRTPVNRLVRYVLRADSTFDPATATLLLDNIPSFGATHNAGDIHFGNDGLLYLSIGDGGRDYARRAEGSAKNPAARDFNVLLGKIVRLTPDGGIPADNPYQGPGTTRCARTGPVARDLVCREIYATGLRNPWRLAFDPNTAGTRFFINDVGEGAWEEVNEGKRAADYGWNHREGYCPRPWRVGCTPTPPELTNPVFAYGRSRGCTAITGGAFVPNGAWPAEYDGAYLFGDFVCRRIFALRQRHGGPEVSVFDREPNVLGLVTMMFRGPVLYYASYILGEVRRVSYTG